MDHPRARMPDQQDMIDQWAARMRAGSDPSDADCCALHERQDRARIAAMACMTAMHTWDGRRATWHTTNALFACIQDAWTHDPCSCLTVCAYGLSTQNHFAKNASLVQNTTPDALDRWVADMSSSDIGIDMTSSLVRADGRILAYCIKHAQPAVRSRWDNASVRPSPDVAASCADAIMRRNDLSYLDRGLVGLACSAIGAYAAAADPCIWAHVAAQVPDALLRRGTKPKSDRVGSSGPVIISQAAVAIAKLPADKRRRVVHDVVDRWSAPVSMQYLPAVQGLVKFLRAVPHDGIGDIAKHSAQRPYMQAVVGLAFPEATKHVAAPLPDSASDQVLERESLRLEQNPTILPARIRASGPGWLCNHKVGDIIRSVMKRHDLDEHVTDALLDVSGDDAIKDMGFNELCGLATMSRHVHDRRLQDRLVLRAADDPSVAGAIVAFMPHAASGERARRAIACLLTGQESGLNGYADGICRGLSIMGPTIPLQERWNMLSMLPDAPRGHIRSSAPLVSSIMSDQPVDMGILLESVMGYDDGRNVHPMHDWSDARITRLVSAWPPALRTTVQGLCLKRIMSSAARPGDAKVLAVFGD